MHQAPPEDANWSMNPKNGGNGWRGVFRSKDIRKKRGIRQRENVVSRCWHLLWNLLTPNKPRALPKASVEPFFTLNAFDLYPKKTASIQHNVHSRYHKCKTWQAGHKTATQSREFLQIWKGCVFWQSGDIWAMRFSTCTRNIWKSDSSWQGGMPAISPLCRSAIKRYTVTKSNWCNHI